MLRSVKLHQIPLELGVVAHIGYTKENNTSAYDTAGQNAEDLGNSDISTLL